MNILNKMSSLLKKRGEAKHPFTSAVIVAGGRGERVGADKPKQHLLVAGKEVVVHSMLAFENCELIDEIIAVCRDGEEAIYDSYKAKYGITKLKIAVTGGTTRQESALRGFEAISEKSKYIAIHDAARCLITPKDIDRILHDAYKYRAASAAAKCTDTIKLIDENGFVSKTLDREHIYLAATPQVFERNLYMTAAYSAKMDGVTVTDDNALAERLGFKVKLTECQSTRLKITKSEDLITAEAMINNNDPSIK